MPISNRVRKSEVVPPSTGGSVGLVADPVTGALKWNPDGESIRSLGQVSIKQKSVFVDVIDGSDSNSGLSPASAKATVAAAMLLLESGDTLYITGKVQEQVTTPVGVFDVTVIGQGNRPRHADASPVGGNLAANTWTYATDNTTPLVTVLQQGWRFVNILFAGPASTSAACVRLMRTAEGADEQDGSHAEFINCRFASGGVGIEQSGGCGHVGVYGCFFTSLTVAIKHTTGAGIGFPVRWVIENSRFNSCPTIMSAVAAQDYSIKYNNFVFATAPTLVFDFTGGARNAVIDNAFNIAATDFDPAGGVTGSGATDVWSNITNTAVETGLPAN